MKTKMTLNQAKKAINEAKTNLTQLKRTIRKATLEVGGIIQGRKLFNDLKKQGVTKDQFIHAVEKLRPLGDSRTVVFPKNTIGAGTFFCLNGRGKFFVVVQLENSRQLAVV